jgi:UDP-N-acetylmuramate dehydrogenase
VSDALGNAEPTLSNVRDAVIAVRRSKSMVIDPDDPNARSCGSFFTNPIVTPRDADRVAAAAVPDVLPTYAAGDGVKIPAAWLIEHAGFSRGFEMGAAGLSTRHTLAIINRGNARADDVAALARRVRDGVRERWGVTLVPEPVFVGHMLDD